MSPEGGAPEAGPRRPALWAMEPPHPPREHGAMPARKESAMNLSRCLTWWRRAPAAPQARVVVPDWVDGGAEPSEAQLDEVLLGCGWFDSSHELQAGLQVTEHASPDAVANELPLGWWLDWAARGAGSAPVRQGLR